MVQDFQLTRLMKILEEAEGNLKLENKDWHFRRGRNQIKDAIIILQEIIEDNNQLSIKQE